jgi:nicotinamidase-related amidase
MGKKVLLVVDYQNDFVSGALGFEDAKRLDSGIAELVKKYANDEDGIIICTFDSHDENYLNTQEGKKLPVPHCIINSISEEIPADAGWSLYGETGKTVRSLYKSMYLHDGSGVTVCSREGLDENGYGTGLYLVNKPTFPSLLLGELLDELNKYSNEIESITVVGVVTNMCVISNAVIAKAACPDAEIIIKKDLVSSFDTEAHQKALDVMGTMQMTVE